MNWLFGKLSDISQEQYDRVYSTLTPSRKAHIDSMKIQEDRKRSLMATYLLQRLLMQYGLSDIEIETDEKGKPYITNKNLYISISHSKEAVACAVSETPVGIDIQIIKPVTEKLINFVSTKEEREYIITSKTNFVQGLADEDTSKRFFSVWTAKEAFYKKNCGEIKNLRSINTLPLKKQTFIIENYYVTII